MSGDGLIVCQGFLVGGACVCVLVGSVRYLLWSTKKFPVVSSGMSMSLTWLWAACLLMLRIVFLYCWRINMVCLALELVGS